MIERACCAERNPALDHFLIWSCRRSIIGIAHCKRIITASLISRIIFVAERERERVRRLQFIYLNAADTWVLNSHRALNYEKLTAWVDCLLFGARSGK